MHELKKRYQALFDVGDKQAFADLRLRRGNTSVRFAGTGDPVHVRDQPTLFGTTLENEKLTCIDCISLGTGHGSKASGERHWFSECFPHFVVLGDVHLDPHALAIRSIHFRADDLETLFYDFDAFSHVIDARPIIDGVLAERRKIRAVEAGEWPQIAYFTGKSTIAEVPTCIGKVRIHHGPRSNMGGPRGVYIKNRIGVEILPDAPMTFSQAVDRLGTMHRFLSAFAGREQRIREIFLRTLAEGEGSRGLLALHWSYVPGRRRKKSVHKPHSGDVPLRPVDRPDEFSAVLRNWLERDAGWRPARVRYLDCSRQANSYSVDRLVAAANMFDILPDTALPPPTSLSAELQQTQQHCLERLAAHPPGADRDSAIAALSRMGKSSLRKKVEFRAARVIEQFDTLNDLAWVLKIAIQARNYFVHGSSDVNARHFWPFMSFFTDALEFVFAASDLIEAGWDAKAWNNDSHGMGHTFARFRWGYGERLAALKAELT